MIKRITGSRNVLCAALPAAVFILTALLASCGNGAGTNQAHSNSGKQPKPTTIHQSISITKSTDDSLIVATVKAGSIPDSIAINIDHDFQRVNLVIKAVDDMDSLLATLHAAGSQRNVRINQLVMPDGTMDGPFGHELHYRTSQNGNYTLKIGKDNMADGTLHGPAVIRIELIQHH